MFSNVVVERFISNWTGLIVQLFQIRQTITASGKHFISFLYFKMSEDLTPTPLNVDCRCCPIRVTRWRRATTGWQRATTRWLSDSHKMAVSQPQSRPPHKHPPITNQLVSKHPSYSTNQPLNMSASLQTSTTCEPLTNTWNPTCVTCLLPTSKREKISVSQFLLFPSRFPCYTRNHPGPPTTVSTVGGETSPRG